MKSSSKNKLILIEYQHGFILVQKELKDKHFLLLKALRKVQVYIIKA